LIADVTIRIDLGPYIAWATLIFVSIFMLYFAYKLGIIREQIGNAAAVQRLIRQQILMPWQAPGPPLLPQRVNPQTGMIERRWGAEEEWSEPLLIEYKPGEMIDESA
jgi:hypothetical protein